MKFLGGIFILLLSVTLTSCTTTHEVNAQYSRLTDFSNLTTYGWFSDMRPIDAETMMIDDGILDERIRQTIEQELSSKGYRKSLTDIPDFLIQYHITIEDNVRSTALDDLYDDSISWNKAMAPTTTSGVKYGQYEYKKGTIIVDFIDTRSNQLLWRGSTEAELYKYDTRMQKTSALKKAIRQILEQFPPQ